METDTLVQLLMQTLARSAVRRMEGRIITICTAAASDLTVPVRTGKAGIENYLLKPLTILAFEISDEGIISFPRRKT
jgi:response regulator of citrate/malate metabolism